VCGSTRFKKCANVDLGAPLVGIEAPIYPHLRSSRKARSSAASVAMVAASPASAAARVNKSLAKVERRGAGLRGGPDPILAIIYLMCPACVACTAPRPPFRGAGGAARSRHVDGFQASFIHKNKPFIANVPTCRCTCARSARSRSHFEKCLFHRLKRTCERAALYSKHLSPKPLFYRL